MRRIALLLLVVWLLATPLLVSGGRRRKRGGKVEEEVENAAIDTDLTFTKAELNAMDGADAYRLAKSLVGRERFAEAADAYWKSILTWKTGGGYTIEEAYQQFMHTFLVRKVPEQGSLYVAKAYLERKELNAGIQYLHESIKIKETATAYLLLAENDKNSDDKTKAQRLSRAFDLAPQEPSVYVPLGNTFYGLKELKLALLCFERAYDDDAGRTDAFANAVYLRSNICAWGKNGTQFRRDMEHLSDIVKTETTTTMLKTNELEQQSVVHPHMTLAYALAPELKLAITSSHSRAEEALIRRSGLVPYDYTPSSAAMGRFRKESSRAHFRIRIGYVSANLKSKTTVYMAQNLMGLHDRSRFEVHAFATTPPDDAVFLDKAMRGVDWRRKIKDSVEYFHDASGLDVAQLSALIHSKGIHILVDWDGYSNNGVRATGLFPIQSAPIQVAHQEYIGTMGAKYIQYLITDAVATPPEAWQYYSEKLLILPHSFLANSFAYQAPNIEPPLASLPKKRQPGTNGCGGARATFVYCNFNKHLKFDADTFRGWLQTLQAVPGSVLCLLEFPAESRENIVGFVKRLDAKLVSRVRFQPYVNNPYDNHKRIIDMCSAILDTPIYNGHTTTAESLWGAVPLVTRSDGVEMSSRVGLSSLTTLGMYHLVANSTQEYQELSARIGQDAAFYKSMRAMLVASTKCSEADGLPVNPYWDLQRYVRNLENGYSMIWQSFLAGKEHENVVTGDVGPELDGAIVCPGSGATATRKVVVAVEQESGWEGGEGEEEERVVGTGVMDDEEEEEEEEEEVEVKRKKRKNGGASKKKRRRRRRRKRVGGGAKKRRRRKRRPQNGAEREL